MDKFDLLYYDIAERVATLSHANRLKVGSVIVKDNRILSYGYNGSPRGFDNACEHEVNGEMVTKPEVIHSEMNALMKVAASHDNTRGASMYITHSPCVECAKAILQSGIKEVNYITHYRSTHVVALLLAGGVSVNSKDGTVLSTQYN